MQGYLEEDFAALRKLRDESECDELKQAWGANDPREWKIEVRGKQERCVQVKGDRVTMLGLNFSSLAVLPDAIGELHALKCLLLLECTSLVKLPAAIGGLGTLTYLFLDGCSSLEKLPDAVVAQFSQSGEVLVKRARDQVSRKHDSQSFARGDRVW